MKLFTTSQSQLIDQFTIENEPVSVADLMERAAIALQKWLLKTFGAGCSYFLVAGPGNNGGDALALARLLTSQGCRCKVLLAANPENLKGPSELNYNRLTAQGIAQISTILDENDIPTMDDDSVIIDALFGSGLNRPAEGVFLYLIKKINESPAVTVSIDVPSGLAGEDNSGTNPDSIVKADYTLTLQYPKLSMLLADFGPYCGKVEILDIELHPKALSDFQSSYYYTSGEEIARMIKPRGKFSQKWNYGSALLIAGSTGKAGAALLGARAAMRSGVGLLTVHLPKDCYKIVQTGVPEAMCSVDPSDKIFTRLPSRASFTAIGAGPGIGTDPQTGKALRELLASKPERLVLDADALNLISSDREMIEMLPRGTILTPHIKEFERLAGKLHSSYERMNFQRELSIRHSIVVILKGAHTCITLPDGTIHFNSTGNPGMSTAGSGDVLTGILLSLLAQGYSPEEAALAGVYLHGLSGDLAASETGEISLIAGDIVDYLPDAFRFISGN